MRLHPKAKRRGFTLIEFFIIVAVLAVLAAAFLPALMKPRIRVKRVNCTNHLKQVGLGFRQWALDHDDKFPDQVSVTNGGTMELVGSGLAYVHFVALSNELNSPKVLLCTTDTNRMATTNWSSLRNRNISYFVALDATDTQPQMFLSGDDNFTVAGTKPKSGLLELWTNAPIAWQATRHMNQGNLGLADGSVQAFSNSRLNRALAETGLATNRLAMP